MLYKSGKDQGREQCAHCSPMIDKAEEHRHRNSHDKASKDFLFHKVVPYYNPFGFGSIWLFWRVVRGSVHTTQRVRKLNGLRLFGLLMRAKLRWYLYIPVQWFHCPFANNQRRSCGSCSPYSLRTLAPCGRSCPRPQEFCYNVCKFPQWFGLSNW